MNSSKKTKLNNNQEILFLEYAKLKGFEKCPEIFEPNDSKRNHSDAYINNQNKIAEYCANYYQISQIKPQKIKQSNLLKNCQSNAFNIYINVINHIGLSYYKCRKICIQNNPQLSKFMANHNKKIFTSKSNDPCIRKCMAQYYFHFNRTNQYFLKDYGYYIENPEKHNQSSFI